MSEFPNLKDKYLQILNSIISSCKLKEYYLNYIKNPNNENKCKFISLLKKIDSKIKPLNLIFKDKNDNIIYNNSFNSFNAYVSKPFISGSITIGNNISNEKLGCKKCQKGTYHHSGCKCFIWK